MNLYIARQPIFDTNLTVFGYELLYREGDEKAKYNGADGDKASSNVMVSSFLGLGMETITAGKKAFINFTESLLKEQIATLFPKEKLVIEVLETIKPTGEIIRACMKLKDMGYTIALDDFVFDHGYEMMVKLADIIKIDFLSTSEEDKRFIVERFKNAKLKFLAEKIETREEFEKAAAYGYSLFQGYFFSKPVLLSTHPIPPYKMNYLKLIKLINEDEPDFNRIADTIGQDVAFSFEILRLVNSVYYYRGHVIKSIKHALIILGIDELKKWIHLAVLRKLGEDKPNEIIKFCMIRGKFLELVSAKIGMARRSAEFMTLGMLSMIDVLTNSPIETILSEISLSENIGNILVYNENTSVLAQCYKLILCYEKGDWESVNLIATSLGLNTGIVAAIYFKSLNWLEHIAAY